METFDSRRLSRRSLLRAMTALAAGAALPPLGMRPARAATPDLPRDFGKGRTVAVIGAGMAGLTAGWKLARSGFKVTIYEADSRYGGRSLTVRPDDDNGQHGAYKRWWFNKYNPQRLFPDMYVSRYQEQEGPAREQQICRFADDTWIPEKGKPPVELFLNAGPGRIPSDHAALLQLCGEIGVELEPYIFQSNYNLLRSKKFRDGQPIAYNQITYSTRGELAAKWAKIEDRTCDPKKSAIINLLKQFGDLDDKCEFPSSARLGYRELPGGWDTPGSIKDKVPLDEVLGSGFVGGGDPEFTPGSFLFNADNIVWQNSLMQPVGGMDRIWQRLLLQPIPEAAIRLHPNDPREREMRGRHVRYVGDLVLLKYPVARIDNVPGTKKIRVVTNGHVEVADFCISTMAPNLLKGILADGDGQFPKYFKDALGEVEQTPAIKVGWQARTRFWEKQNHIYGGISWTDDDIGQIWYPSEDFNAPTGVLTGAYNRGRTATAFGNLTQKERIAEALEGGQHLHPSTGPNEPGFKSEIYTDRGLTIAWQYMPFQVGGWPGPTASSQPAIYRTIIKPQGQLYLAGDAYSYLPGWQEGAVTSVYKAIEALPPA